MQAKSPNYYCEKIIRIMVFFQHDSVITTVTSLTLIWCRANMQLQTIRTSEQLHYCFMFIFRNVNAEENEDE